MTPATLLDEARSILACVARNRRLSARGRMELLSARAALSFYRQQRWPDAPAREPELSRFAGPLLPRCETCLERLMASPGNNLPQMRMLRACLDRVRLAIHQGVEPAGPLPARDWAAAQLPTGDRV